MVSTQKKVKSKYPRPGKPSGERVYGEPKQQRTLTVTETGWIQSKALVKDMGYKSVSEFLEDFGRNYSGVVNWLDRIQQQAKETEE